MRHLRNARCEDKVASGRVGKDWQVSYNIKWPLSILICWYSNGTEENDAAATATTTFDVDLD